MRFEIGQQVPFINVKYHKKPNSNNGFSFLFDPRIHDLDSVEVKLLEVIEHHNVPWDQDPTGEKKHHGFVFKELNSTEEQIWHNQYPMASYGQMNDSADRVVTRRKTHLKLEEIAKFSKEQADYWMENWNQALPFISNIKRAIDGDDRHRLKLSPEDKKLFEEYLSIVEKKVEEITGKKIQYKEFSHNGITLEGHWEAELI